jgi:hypothetical protein
MKVTFDQDGYVEMLVKVGDLPNSTELPDDDIDMKYISCYKLGYDGTKLVLDGNKVQRLESNLRAETKIYDLKKQISDTDYKVLRHIRETALGIPTSMTQQEYLVLEAKRESIVRQVREIEDGTNLETDSNAILDEGLKNRNTESEKEKTIEETVNKIVPDLEKDVKSLKGEISDEEEIIVEDTTEEIIEEPIVEENVEEVTEEIETETVENTEEAKEEVEESVEEETKEETKTKKK